MKLYKNKITYISFILAVLVVIRHSVNIEVYGLTSGTLYWIELVFREISDVAVPMFFTLSGFLFFQNYKPELLKEKWKSRVFSILVPYFAWNIIAYVYYELIYLLPLVSENMSSAIEPFNFEWLIKNMLFGYHNITWFLQNLFLYIMIVPLLFPILQNKTAGIAFTIAVFLAGCFCRGFGNIAFNGVFYLVGACLGIHQRDAVQRRYNVKLVIFSIAFFCLIAVLNILFPLVNYVSRTPIRIVQCLLLWIAAEVVAIDSSPKWWMSISFIIYCSHSMILESIEKLFKIVFGDTVLGAMLDFVFAPIITLSIIFIVSAIVKKQKMLWKILSGNR